MLTVEKLRTYAEFRGELDGWVRATAGRDRSGMTDADWYLIDELLLGLTAVHAGLASPALVLDVESKVLASTEDSAARAALRALVGALTAPLEGQAHRVRPQSLLPAVPPPAGEQESG